MLTDLQSVEQRRFSGSVEAEDEDPHFAAAQEAFEVAEEATHGEKSQKLTKSGCLFLYWAICIELARLWLGLFCDDSCLP